MPVDGVTRNKTVSSLLKSQVSFKVVGRLDPPNSSASMICMQRWIVWTPQRISQFGQLEHISHNDATERTTELCYAAQFLSVNQFIVQMENSLWPFSAASNCRQFILVKHNLVKGQGDAETTKSKFVPTLSGSFIAAFLEVISKWECSRF